MVSAGRGYPVSFPSWKPLSASWKSSPYPVIVKEVGQGMGPESLTALLGLPLQAIEFAAFGGTNFARVELLRDENASQALFEPLSKIGEDAPTMVAMVNQIVAEEPPVCKELIISGGIKNFLDGYYLIQKSIPSGHLWNGIRFP